MPARTASIGARLQLDRTAFSRALSSADSDARGFARSLSSVEGPSARWTGLASKIQVVGAAFGAVTGAAQKAFDVFSSVWESGAKMEDMLAALSSVAKGTESVADQMKALKEASSLPGVGLQEMAAGSVVLQGVGMEAKKSRALLAEFGNALASAGRGKADLEAVTGAAAKIINNDKLDENNLDVMGDRIPAITNIKNAIPDKTKIRGKQFMDILIAELGKLPRMKTTAHGERDNLSDQWDQVTAQLGMSKIGQAGTGVIRGFSEGLGKMDTSSAGGWLKGVVDVAQSTYAGANEAYDEAKAREAKGQTLVDKYEVPEEERKKRQTAFDEGVKAAAESRFQTVKKVFDLENELLKLQEKSAKAQAEGDFEKKKALEEEIVILKDKQKLADSANITIEQATALLQGQAKAQRALKEADPAAAQFREKTQQSEQVAQLRDRGRNRAANKLEEQQTRDDRLRELQSNGFSEKDATTIADLEARRRRRQRHFERTGRRLIGGASTPDDHKTGIDNALFSEHSFTNDYKFFPPRSAQEQTDKQSDREMFRQTGKIGDLNLSTPNSRLRPTGKSTRDDPKLTGTGESKPASTRDTDWSRIDGLNGNPPPPPRDRTIKGAGRKEDPESEGARPNSKMQPTSKDFGGVGQLVTELKEIKELLRQNANPGSVASKTAPQSKG